MQKRRTNQNILESYLSSRLIKRKQKKLREESYENRFGTKMLI